MTDELAHAAYRARCAMYVRAGLRCGAVEAPDTRWRDAVATLGPEHPIVRAAVRRRNALAAVAEPIVVAMARSYAHRGCCLEEAAQEGRVGALRAAELWRPDGGAGYPTYARRWIRRQTERLVDQAAAVSSPRRRQPVEVVEVDADVLAGSQPDDDGQQVGAQVEQLLGELPRPEAGALACLFGVGGGPPLSVLAAGKALGLRPADVTALRDRGLLLLRDGRTCPRCGLRFLAGRRRYCSAECSSAARAEQVRQAGRRYQESRAGRRRHAARQHRYRERQIVTHHPQPSPGTASPGYVQT